MEDGAHPARITAGEIIVNGDKMNAVTCQGVEIDGQRGDQRLAFTGTHLGDAALVEDNAADELHIVMTLPDGALGGFADGSEGFGEEFIQYFPFHLVTFLGLLNPFRLGVQPFAELVRLEAQLIIGQFLKVRFQGVDLRHKFGGFLDLFFIGVAPEGFDKFLEHGFNLSGVDYSMGLLEAGKKSGISGQPLPGNLSARLKDDQP
jgi:hypothetical protein